MHRGSVSFSCIPATNGTPTYSLYRDGAVIGDAIVFPVTDREVFTLTNLDANNSGNYTCETKVLGESLSSNVIQLTVQGRFITPFTCNEQTKMTEEYESIEIALVTIRKNCNSLFNEMFLN